MAVNQLDITPSPRILRTLGEIPFQPWQCLAELIDNSIDAFSESERKNIQLKEKKISVTWSSENVSAANRVIEVSDSGPGMNITQIQNAVRAGYSSNDPINNLGLFGMGFNISTARLGEKTRLLSSTIDSNEWVGVEIDFATLIKSKSFTVPIIHEPKKNPKEHGTKVIVSLLKNGMYSNFRDNETTIRRRLEIIYTPLFDLFNDVELFIQGKKISPRKHCVWSSNRFVNKSGKNIPAIINIEKTLGNALFDTDRNTYLSGDEEIKYIQLKENGEKLPSNIVERNKIIKGWIGIQRFSDPSEFGIDFIRNGRKILTGSKLLFEYENPLTGTTILEYPVELGSTVGGRIVGEIHVDYLIPTYQKNDFDKTDLSWQETIEALRGIGPILPKTRKTFQFNDENSSPLSLLVNAFRRPDPGTRNLFIEKNLARQYLEYFRKGDPAYLNDEKWWQAALEVDRNIANKGAGISPEVDDGITPSDDADDYLPEKSISAPEKTTIKTGKEETKINKKETSNIDNLISDSRLINSNSGNYSYGETMPLSLSIYELQNGSIKVNDEHSCCFFYSDGIECKFIYDPKHPFFTSFTIEPRELAAVYLAEKFKARDNHKDIGKIFADLIQQKMKDIKIDRIGLKEKAEAVFDLLRDKMLTSLENKTIEILNCIHESVGEVEETYTTILNNTKLLKSFQEKSKEGIEVLRYVPPKTLLRIVGRFPEDLFDNKVFSSPFLLIKMSDPKATERMRNESLDRIIIFLKDALWLTNQTLSNKVATRTKNEFARCSHSINFLMEELQA